MEPANPDSAVSSPREVVAYLLGLRPILSGATQARRAWIREVGLLLEEARSGDPVALARQAGKLGRAQLPVFREARSQIVHLEPPPECQPPHQAVLQWIDEHIRACETMVKAEESHGLRPLRETQAHLAEGRRHIQQFNAEYNRLIGLIRDRVEEALERRRASGLRTPRRRRRSGGLWWPLLRRRTRDR